MSEQGRTHIDLRFADGTYRFALGLEQIREIQRASGIGIGAVYARVLQGRVTDDVTVGHPAFAAYHLEDLVATVKQGLIGGAMGWVDEQEIKVGAMLADDLVARYLHAMPLARQWDLAAAILFAKIEGYDDGVKKKRGRTRTRKGGSTTPEH